jgi:hypothetical protein
LDKHGKPLNPPKKAEGPNSRVSSMILIWDFWTSNEYILRFQKIHKILYSIHSHEIINLDKLYWVGSFAALDIVRDIALWKGKSQTE